MARELNKQDLENIIIGATILGSGGGGSYKQAKTIVDELNENFSANLITIDELNYDNRYLVMPAVMGPPSQISKLSDKISGIVSNGVDALQTYCKDSVTECIGFTYFYYFYNVEVGALNAMLPAVTAYSSEYQISILDADGAGRAVPLIDLLLPAVTISSNPASVASISKEDGTYDSAISNCEGVEGMENILGAVSSVLEDKTGGVALYPTTTNQIKGNSDEMVVEGTITLAQKIGEYYSSTQQNEIGGIERAQSIAKLIMENSGREAKIICSGTVESITFKPVSGSDTEAGVVKISTDDGEFDIIMQNENLYGQFGGNTPIVMGPDSTCYIPDEATQDVFDNSDLKDLLNEGKKPKIYVLAIEAASNVLSNSAMMATWESVINKAGYNGQIVNPWREGN